MPYFLTGDEFADDPVWEVLAEGNQRTIQAIKCGFIDLCAKSSHLRTNGYLTAQTVARYCTPRVVALLRMSVLGRAPRLHVRGDECPCLVTEWVAGYDYRIHHFLKKNPSRKERDRNEQQKADLNNVALKHLVWVRDGGCCRYCRSGILNKKSGRFKDLRKVLNFDHMDPDQPAGVDGANLLTACKRCNAFKGHRTPAEADMVVLPVPTFDQLDEWEKRGPRTFELTLHQHSISSQATADQSEPLDPGIDPDVDPQIDPDTANSDETTPQVDLGTAAEQAEQAAHGSGKSPGRVGEPPPPSKRPTGTGHPTGQPVRTSAEPDIYHGRARPPVSPPPPPPPSDRIYT